MQKIFTIPIIIILLGLFIFLNLQKGFFQFRQEPIACPDCNIILVSFDTLRADNVGALGYPKNTTPTIDQFAQREFNFTNAISVASWTLPSHMSWFTGVYPSEHKVLNKFTIDEEIVNLGQVSPDLVTLAQILQENGYRTGGFTGGAAVHHQFGFDQGFEIYTDNKDFAGFEESIPKALEWIKNHQGEKIFLFLHGYDIHGQYVPPDGYDYRFVDFDYQGPLTGSKEEQKELREEGLTRGQIFLTPDDVRFLTALYDEKVQRADEQFSRFVAEYQKLGLMDKTVFILSSDHGEELYEHGRIDHGHSLYEELVKVPLIISLSGKSRGREIQSQVRSIDLMPTILELVGAGFSEQFREQMAGSSLMPLMQGQKDSLVAFLETDYRYAVFQRAIRTPERWKLILNLKTGVKELYNLTQDSEEKKNLVSKLVRDAGLLEQKLKEHLDQFGQ